MKVQRQVTSLIDRLLGILTDSSPLKLALGRAGFDRSSAFKRQYVLLKAEFDLSPLMIG
jgi:hypothetical protein